MRNMNNTTKLQVRNRLLNYVSKQMNYRPDPVLIDRWLELYADFLFYLGADKESYGSTGSNSQQAIINRANLKRTQEKLNLLEAKIGCQPIQR